MATVSIRTSAGVKDFRFITRDWHNLSLRVENVKRMVFSGRQVLYETENGDLFSPELRNFAYMPAWYEWTGQLLKCLVKLKRLTAEELWIEYSLEEEK